MCDHLDIGNHVISKRLYPTINSFKCDFQVTHSSQLKLSNLKGHTFTKSLSLSSL